MTNKEYAKLKHKAQLESLADEIASFVVDRVASYYGIYLDNTYVYFEIEEILGEWDIQFKS